MKKKVLLITVLTIFCLAAEAGATNLVVNGGFESPVIYTVYVTDITPTGWTGMGDLVQQGYAGAVNSGDGNQWFDLNPGTSTSTGTSQNISLNAGTDYLFSFLYDGGGGGTTTQISFSLQSGLGSLLSGAVSTASMNVYGGTPWSTYSTTFDPSISGLYTLTFVPNGAWSGGFIDAVTISPTGTPTPGVPEPTTILLLGLGLIGVAGIRRKFKN
jgi:hypothetical protein